METRPGRKEEQRWADPAKDYYNLPAQWPKLSLVTRRGLVGGLRS